MQISSSLDSKLTSYDNLQLSENLKQIAIDFDGVIHKSSKGFFDGTVYDEPVEGSIEAIQKLHSDGYEIVIFTAKAKPDRPLVNGKTGAELVWDWLEKYDIQKYIKQVTSEKPRAIAYIDDKGIRFTDWGTTLNLLNEITYSRP